MKWRSETPSVPTELLPSGEFKGKVPGVAPSFASRGESMPPRRYQRGRLFSQGKKRRQWVGVFREDRIDPATGALRRVRRSVRLGLVKHVTKAQALTEFQQYLDAVNL